MTEERKRIIAELDHIRSYFEAKADTCIGKGKMLLLNWANVARDAGELLKAQEPRVLTLEEATGGDECWFEHINGSNGYADVYCHWNGAVWVSRINKIVSMIPAEAYGKQWRCWSYRPTDEQRKAVRWE